LIALLNIFEIVAPVFILTAMGYFWIKIGFEYPCRFYNSIFYNFGCAMFSFYGTYEDRNPIQ